MALFKRMKQIAIILMMVSVLLYLFSLNCNPKSMPFWETAIIEIFSPIEGGVHRIFSGLNEAFNHYVNLVGVKRENCRLRSEIVSLKKNLNVYREAYFENLRLRKLLGFKKKFFSWPTTPAEVVTWDPSGWYQSITINKGFLDGVRREMPVINAYGVVGKVIALSPHYSRVLLLLDPNFALDSFIQRNRIHGIITGYKNNICSMKYVQQNQDIKEGDAVITSGLAGLFPKGLPVGRVIQVKTNEAQLFQKIYVKPCVNFSRLEEVLVILKERPIFNDGKPFDQKRGSK